MKKIILGIAFLFIAQATQAQISKHAIGLRSNYGWGYGSEITYQYGFNDVNRIQLDLGFRGSNYVSATNITATYQWVKDLPSLGDHFRWFYGGGASAGFLNYDSNFIVHTYPTTSLNLVGIGGIEYDFKTTADLPLLISFDMSPSISLLNSYYNSFYLNPALSIRWQID